MRQLSLILALSLATGLYGLRSAWLEARLETLESTAHSESREVEILRGELIEAHKRLVASNGEIERLAELQSESHVFDEALAARDASFAGQLQATQRALDTAQARVQELEAASQVTPEDPEPELDRRFDELKLALDSRWQDLDVDLRTTSAIARETRSQLSQLEGTLDRNVHEMWGQVMGPTVQLAGESTVGTGVLLESRPAPDGDGYVTYLLTAWHVVRDILSDAELDEGPIPVKVYSRSGSTRDFEATLIRFDAGIDAALLEVETRERFEYGARLASRSQLASVAIFDDVYAAGCPLGNDPIPTRGEIADTRHIVDGEHYWMISAPTYIGNSGGGIFDGETLEIVGIFSKIYTHGSLRPTVVPHMGLATPLATIYDWLEKEGLTELVMPKSQSDVKAASASR